MVNDASATSDSVTLGETGVTVASVSSATVRTDMAFCLAEITIGIGAYGLASVNNRDDAHSDGIDHHHIALHHGVFKVRRQGIFERLLGDRLSGQIGKLKRRRNWGAHCNWNRSGATHPLLQHGIIDRRLLRVGEPDLPQWITGIYRFIRADGLRKGSGRRQQK